MAPLDGILLIKNENEFPPLPDGITWDSPVISPYGYKVEYNEGKPYWVVATEDDYREAEAQRLGISPADVRPKGVFDCDALSTPPFCSESGCLEHTCLPVIKYTKGVHYYRYCTCRPL